MGDSCWVERRRADNMRSFICGTLERGRMARALVGISSTMVGMVWICSVISVSRDPDDYY